MFDPYFFGQPRALEHAVQYALDHRVTEDVWKMRRVPRSPLRHIGNPILVPDKPWENMVSGPNVYPMTDGYRMIYRSFNVANYFDRSRGPAYYSSFADSADGFHWEKPLSTQRPFGPFPATNVVLQPHPWSEAIPDQMAAMAADVKAGKKKVLACQPTPGSGGRVGLVFSDDARIWGKEGPVWIADMHLDAGNQVLWSESAQRFFLFTRPPISAAGTKDLPEGRRHTRRRVAVSTSEDLVHWTEPRTVLYPDEVDIPDYNSFFVFCRHGLFFGLASMMEQELGETGEQSIYLCWSEDGFHWHRLPERTPWFDRSRTDSWDSAYVHMCAVPPIEYGDNELLFYYSGSPVGEGSMYRESAIGVARMLKDRFIGLEAGEETGYLLTRQFICPGPHLRINAECWGGSYREPELKVEVLDQAAFGQPMVLDPPAADGFSFADCDIGRANGTEHLVTWNGSPDLSQYLGKPIQLRFRCRRSTLFTFQIDSQRV